MPSSQIWSEFGQNFINSLKPWTKISTGKNAQETSKTWNSEAENLSFWMYLTFEWYLKGSWKPLCSLNKKSFQQLWKLTFHPFNTLQIQRLWTVSTAVHLSKVHNWLFHLPAYCKALQSAMLASGRVKNNRKTVEHLWLLGCSWAVS